MTEDAEDGLNEYDTVAKDPLEAADEEKADAKVQPFIDPELALCPVVPLGFEGGKIVFAMPEGEIRREPAAKIGTMLRADIFACAKGQSFLTNWRDREDKFLRELCAVWFVRKCRAAGLWDASRPMRGLGVWPANDGQLVLHVGDRIWRLKSGKKFEDLSIFEALKDRSGALYRLRPPAPRPTTAAKAEATAWVREWLDGWRFEPIGDKGLSGADVVAGWLMASLLGGFAPFRGHLLLHALAGSGKTELMLFVQRLLSALVTDNPIDSFSEAGLKNGLAGEARPVLIDEAEGGTGHGGPGVVERALELLRRMATGDGGNRLQGDIGGGTVTQTAVGAAMVAGITPPRLGPADASRFVEIRLLPLSGALRTRGELEAGKERAKALAPALLGRALKGAWRYRADVEAVTLAMVQAGEQPRSADLVAMLIAGLRLLLHDEPLTVETAAVEMARWRPLLESRTASESVSNDGLDALAHLMAADCGVTRHDKRMTLGQVVERWATHDNEHADVVVAYGLKVLKEAGPDGRPGPWLLVANNHPKLEHVFRGTKWSDWRRALSYLDAVSPEHRTWSPPTSQRFGLGVKQRCIAIPLSPWLEIHAAVPRDREADQGDRGQRSGVVPPAVPEEDADAPHEFR